MVIRYRVNTFVICRVHEHSGLIMNDKSAWWLANILGFIIVTCIALLITFIASNNLIGMNYQSLSIEDIAQIYCESNNMELVYYLENSCTFFVCTDRQNIKCSNGIDDLFIDFEHNDWFCKYKLRQDFFGCR